MLVVFLMGLRLFSLLVMTLPVGVAEYTKTATATRQIDMLQLAARSVLMDTDLAVGSIDIPSRLQQSSAFLLGKSARGQEGKVDT
ncbi:unnamed protein product [Sphagnum jensenii]|uniref:Uncharacterized protein n=1 Tax=Sphagnum jensenii TaxID=128206 RepID=A0ABP1BX39_9BRYO